MTWTSAGAILGLLGVAAGAIGAHLLRGRVAPELLEVYRTGAQYHLVHALALVSYAVWRERRAGSAWPAWAWVLGIGLFSGSLYLLALSGWRTWGMLTPLGGLALLAGWAGWAWQARANPS